MQKFSRVPVPFSPLVESRFLKGEDSLSLQGLEEMLSSCEFLASGRDALARIARVLKEKKTLWLPSYFCPALIRILSNFFELKFFEDYPSESSPRFETLNPQSGDFVLCVNFFALRSREIWQGWTDEHKDIAIIEDHTHAPFSDWAMNSSADFAFASFRKSLPLPDGAYLRCKNFAPAAMFKKSGTMADFAASSLSAASLLATIGNFSKEVESLYYDAENKLAQIKSPKRISAYSLALLEKLDFNALENTREHNLKVFAKTLKPSTKFSLIGNKFLPILKFKSREDCSRTYKKLSDAGVLLSVYWGGFGSCASERLKEEAQTSLAIALDWRHTESDAEKIATLLD